MKKASKSTDVKNTKQDQYMAAVQQDWWALKDVPEGLRDKKLCLAAVQQDVWALQFVPEAVQRANPAIPLAAVQQNDAWALQHVPEAVQLALPAIPLAAVKQDGEALQYVSEAVQRDHPAIPLAAVQQDRMALEFVPESLKTNVEALAKLYTTSEAQLRSDLTLLQINGEVIEEVICSLKAPIATSSSMLMKLLGTGNDSKQPAENTVNSRDFIPDVLLPIIQGYVHTPPIPGNDAEESNGFTH